MNETLNTNPNLNSTNWGELENNFEGETNINSATGKERTFSEWDVYPRQKGETPQEYGDRLKRMHEQTAEYQAKAAEEERLAAEEQARQDYLNSEFGQQEAAARAAYDRIGDKLENAINEGRMTAEHAASLLEQQDLRTKNIIENARQDYQDRQTVGPEEQQLAYEQWFAKRGITNQDTEPEPTTVEPTTPEPLPQTEPEPTTTEPELVSTPEPAPTPEPEVAPKDTRTIEERISAIEIGEDGKINLISIKDYVIDKFAEINDKAEPDSEKLSQKKELIANLLEEVRLMQDFLNKANSIINNKDNEPAEPAPAENTEAEPAPAEATESAPTPAEPEPSEPEPAPAAEKEPVSIETKEKAKELIDKMNNKAVNDARQYVIDCYAKKGVPETSVPTFGDGGMETMYKLVYNTDSPLDQQTSDRIKDIWWNLMSDTDRRIMRSYLLSPAQKGNSYAITAWLKANNLLNPEARPAA